MCARILLCEQVLCSFVELKKIMFTGVRKAPAYSFCIGFCVGVPDVVVRCLVPFFVISGAAQLFPSPYSFDAAK